MPAVQILALNKPGVAPQIVLRGAHLASENEGPSRKKALLLKEALALKAPLQIKAAELWLKLGKADQALRELEALPSRTWECGWAIKTRIAAMGVLRERSEVTVHN